MIGLGIRIGNQKSGAYTPIEIVPALQFRTPPKQYLRTATNFIINTGFSMSFKSDWLADNSSQYYFGHDIGPTSANAVTIYCNALNNTRVIIVANSVQYIKDFPNLSFGDEIRLDYPSSETWEIYLNGVLQETFNTVGYTSLNRQMIWGNFSDSPGNGVNAKIWGLQLNGETWDFSEGTGTTATGSLGTTLQLSANGGVIDDMWTTNVDNTFRLFYTNDGLKDLIVDSYFENKRLQKLITIDDTDIEGVTNLGGFRLDTPLLAPINDNVPPVQAEGKNLGAAHGWYGYRFTMVGHDKTIADDIYSVWQNGSDQWILYNISGTLLSFALLGVDVSPGSPPPNGTYTHVSGAVHTTDITVSGSKATLQMTPSFNVISNKVYLDGVETAMTNYNSYQPTENIRIEQIYDVVDELSAKNWLVSQQGTGVIAENNLGSTVLFRLTNNYTIDEEYFITGTKQFEVVKNNLVFDYTIFEQQVDLLEIGDSWYIPKTIEFTDVDGTFNFSNLTPYQNISLDKNFISGVYEFPSSPPDRAMMLKNDEEWIYVVGFLPVYDAAIGTRVNNVNEAISLSNIEKIYMRGNTATVVGTPLPTGTIFKVNSYRGVIPKSTERTASYFVTDHDTGKGYMYADWHDLPTVDSIPVPPKYRGRTYTVLEKTSNVTLAAGTLGSSLSISIAATHNYGFVTIEIAV